VEVKAFALQDEGAHAILKDRLENYVASCN
jgi:hypothetical protein